MVAPDLGTQVLSVHSLKLACWNGRAERGVPRHANRTADYIRVVDSITAQIRGGELAPGDKLPTCAQLADHFKVSVTTAQTALRILRMRGLVEGHQGKGTYVAERPDPA